MAWALADPFSWRFFGGCGILCVLGVCLFRSSKKEPIALSAAVGLIWGATPLVFYLWPVTLFRVLTGYREQGELYHENGPAFFLSSVAVMTCFSLTHSLMVGLLVGAFNKIMTEQLERFRLFKRE
jgi:hypothetical protein